LKKQEDSYRKILSLAIRPRKLTKRECEIVKLVAEGYKNREMAERLGIAVKTVETHRANIMNKLPLHNVAQLIRYAIQRGIVSIEVEYNSPHQSARHYARI